MGFAGDARFLLTLSIVCLSVTLIKAQGSGQYTTLLGEIKKWQAENPTECGLDTPSCGIKNMQERFESCSAFRVVNGCPVEKPLTVGWQAGINFGSELCSGTLVSPQHVLLAAHCVENTPAVQKIRVFLGTNDMNKPASSKQLQSVTVASYAHDPNYNPETITRDVAIIKLSKAVGLQSGEGGLRVACLPVAGPAPLSATTKGQCMVAGFGINDFRGRGAGGGSMRYTMLSIKNEAMCKTTYRNQYNHATMFCAVGERQGLGTDSCDGDSGSSLLCKDSTGRWVVTGIVSFGAKNCGQIPGVYADAHKLGLTVPNPRPVANQKCKSASDANNKPTVSTISPLQPPNISGFTVKRPGGTSATIELTKKEHGCSRDDQCQTNICRFVALCVQEKQQARSGWSWFNFFGSRSSGEARNRAIEQPYRAYASNNATQQINSRGLGSQIAAGLMKPVIKLGSIINMGTLDDVHKRFVDWRLSSSIFGSLFTKRKCEMASICWNNEWSLIPTIPVAMFEE